MVCLQTVRVRIRGAEFWGEFSSEAVPLIDCAVIIKAVGAMKSGKTCSEDRLVAEMLFPLPVEGMLVLCVLFREVLMNRRSRMESDTEVWLHVVAFLLKKVTHVKLSTELRGISVLPTLASCSVVCCCFWRVIICFDQSTVPSLRLRMVGVARS